ncbi:hypothetical protein CspeluHIS016_0802100 [Cutaneotrichosporon spelunceum]|uniref:Uncharacterized protein n=1 Tax=Cutaneotrichosporon spelunceum TaxID=1672016 RepID=A0AAD3YF09_9TREE|nr:hypothetical protein CspeluHIS016_0802100 [Cutaneotrichosporon spelunceum]
MNSALRTTPKKTVRFAPDTKVVDTSDISAFKYRRHRFAPPKPPTPQPKPVRAPFRPDMRDVVAARERMSHMSRGWMY